MVLIDELRVCTSCGIVFSRKAGKTIVTNCPNCDGPNFDSVDVAEEELVQE